MMKTPRACCLFLLALATGSVGCSKTEGTTTGSASPSGAPAAAAPGASGAPGAAPAGNAAKCGAGETGDESGAFCIKLPGSGWKQKVTASKTAIGTAMNDFSFSATPSRSDAYVTGFSRDTADLDYESHQKNFEVDAKAQGGFEAQGDLAKGTGKFFVYTDVNKANHCFAIAKRGKTFVKVDVAAYGGKKVPADLLEACKSVYMPE